jgi:energy-coupling factor transporter ATP-binding protein EcfA2
LPPSVGEMPDVQRFTSVSFRNYKALREYAVSLGGFNILVGPNNSGKSTILGAFRILAEGIRKASTRNPELLKLRERESWGYRVPLEDVPIATENIFSDYDDSQPATITFRLSGGHMLELVFPAANLCVLTCGTRGRPVRSASHFRREFRATVGFVPVLGPVEHDEPLYKEDAARRALLTHRASRYFRNIWYHYPELFEEFRGLIRSTWPGMDIEQPEIDRGREKLFLRMFCPEDRFPRELYWAGFGFQVWCQMLTFIVRSRSASLLIIDEPDIYLHSDLQRQLVGLLKSLDSDVLLATHSTEIISEAEPGDLLIINKRVRSAERIKDPAQLQSVFSVLGSNLNPTLTQLGKTRRVVYFRLLSAFARKLGRDAVANRGDFAVVSAEGFNPQKVSDLARGMELTLGARVVKAVIFDRDYRSEDEVGRVRGDLLKFATLAHVHRRKELENYLLEPAAMERALQRQVEEHNKRSDKKIYCDERIAVTVERLSAPMKHKVSAQFLAKRSGIEKALHPGFEGATITQRLLDEFEEVWSDWSKRRDVIPGKEFLGS